MKKNILVLLLLAFAGLAPAAAQDADSVSVYLLRRMTANLAGLQAFSLRVDATYDVPTSAVGYVKHSDQALVRALRPDKLTVERWGDGGRQFLVYNGACVQIYNRLSNTYSDVDATGNIAEMMDYISTTYGIEFPAADLFYPEFVEDALTTTAKLAYLGVTSIDGRECFHLAARTPEMDWQLWLSDDALTLPLRLVIVYTGVEGNPQYRADYTDWKLNEPAAPALFEFAPVPGVRTVPLKSSKTTTE